jgi:hypothetical protein
MTTLITLLFVLLVTLAGMGVVAAVIWAVMKLVGM